MNDDRSVEWASRPFVDQPALNGRDARSTRLPYFRTAERVESLLGQIEKWRTTRWAHAGNRPNDMKCGVSGDCLWWVHAFKAIGALPSRLEMPPYRKMEAAADQMQLLRERIEVTGRAQLIMEKPTPVSPPGRGLKGWVPFLPGDVLLFRNGMSGAHCGMAIQMHPFHFVHLSRNGLNEEPFLQLHWVNSLAYIYRLVEVERASRPFDDQSEVNGRDARSTEAA